MGVSDCLFADFKGLSWALSKLCSNSSARLRSSRRIRRNLLSSPTLVFKAVAVSACWHLFKHSSFDTAHNTPVSDPQVHVDPCNPPSKASSRPSISLPVLTITGLALGLCPFILCRRPVGASLTAIIFDNYVKVTWNSPDFRKNTSSTAVPSLKTTSPFLYAISRK